jgi:uncharacterized integral membrane protein
VRLFSWLIGFPLAVVAALFAVSNKGAATFALWPLPFTLEAPLYLATLIALVAGFIVGGFIAWAGQGGARRRARRLSDRVYNLERELKESQARAALAEKKLAEKTAPVSGEPKASVGAPLTPGAMIGAVKPALTSSTLH